MRDIRFCTWAIVRRTWGVTPKYGPPVSAISLKALWENATKRIQVRWKRAECHQCNSWRGDEQILLCTSEVKRELHGREDDSISGATCSRAPFSFSPIRPGRLEALPYWFNWLVALPGTSPAHDKTGGSRSWHLSTQVIRRLVGAKLPVRSVQVWRSLEACAESVKGPGKIASFTRRTVSPFACVIVSTLNGV